MPPQKEDRRRKEKKAKRREGVNFQATAATSSLLNQLCFLLLLLSFGVNHELTVQRI
jgi:hypothetical protein